MGVSLARAASVFQLALVDARLRHAVQLDGQAAFQRGMQARHARAANSSRAVMLPEHLRAEGVRG